MPRPSRNEDQHRACEIVDFDDALLNAVPSETRIDLIQEARLLASVFAPRGGPDALTRMAAQLSAGERDREIDRSHARRLAAALKYLAKTT